MQMAWLEQNDQSMVNNVGLYCELFATSKLFNCIWRTSVAMPCHKRRAESYAAAVDMCCLHDIEVRACSGGARHGCDGGRESVVP